MLIEQAFPAVRRQARPGETIEKTNLVPGYCKQYKDGGNVG
jgi:hypothetical protein